MIIIKYNFYIKYSVMILVDIEIIFVINVYKCNYISLLISWFMKER
jgi:hypothetical protein